MSAPKLEKAIQFKKPDGWYERFRKATRQIGSTPSAKARELCENWLAEHILNQKKGSAAK